MDKREFVINYLVKKQQEQQELGSTGVKVIKRLNTEGLYKEFIELLMPVTLDKAYSQIMIELREEEIEKLLEEED